jgi:hypothetical protein
MMGVALYRTLEGFIAGSGLSHPRRSGSDHGRQDKSADGGRAQWIGRIGDFRRRARSCGWRFRDKDEGIQRTERRRTSQQRSPSR